MRRTEQAVFDLRCLLLQRGQGVKKCEMSSRCSIWQLKKSLATLEIAVLERWKQRLCEKGLVSQFDGEWKAWEGAIDQGNSRDRGGIFRG